MAHRRTGGRGGEQSEMTDNFAPLVLDISESLLSMDKVFLERRPRNSSACTQTTHILSMSKLLQKHICAFLSRTFFGGSDIEEESCAKV